MESTDGVHSGPVGHVERCSLGSSAAAPDILDDVVHPRRDDVVDVDGCPRLSERGGNRPADTLSGSRDECPLSVEVDLRGPFR